MSGVITGEDGDLYDADNGKFIGFLNRDKTQAFLATMKLNASGVPGPLTGIDGLPISAQSAQTTASRQISALDLELIIKANHASTPIALTIPSDLVLGIANDGYSPVVSAFQKGAAAVTFVAGANVVLLGTPRASVQNGPPIAVWRIGVNGPNTEWGYL